MPDPVQTYSELHPTPISSTISVLARRIQERFPGSGLSQVAAELVTVAGTESIGDRAVCGARCGGCVG